MFELLSGIGLAAATCFVLTLLPADYARDLTAILLVLIASITLVSLLLLKDDQSSEIRLPAVSYSSSLLCLVCG
jgi:uncharacterized membrane protein SirB2